MRIENGTALKISNFQDKHPRHEYFTLRTEDGARGFSFEQEHRESSCKKEIGAFFWPISIYIHYIIFRRRLSKDNSKYFFLCMYNYTGKKISMGRKPGTKDSFILIYQSEVRKKTGIASVNFYNI